MSDVVNAPVRIGTYATKAKRKRAENRAAAPSPEGAQQEKRHIASRLKAIEQVKAKLGRAEYDSLRLQFEAAKAVSSEVEDGVIVAVMASITKGTQNLLRYFQNSPPVEEE